MSPHLCYLGHLSLRRQCLPKKVRIQLDGRALLTFPCTSSAQWYTGLLFPVHPMILVVCLFFAFAYTRILLFPPPFPSKMGQLRSSGCHPLQIPRDRGVAGATCPRPGRLARSGKVYAPTVTHSHPPTSTPQPQLGLQSRQRAQPCRNQFTLIKQIWSAQTLGCTDVSNRDSYSSKSTIHQRHKGH